MGLLLALLFVVWFMYLLTCSCIFNNHKYKYEKTSFFYKRTCTSCGHSEELSGYEGIEG